MRREACLVGALGLLGPCLAYLRLWAGGFASLPTVAAVWRDQTTLMWPTWGLAVVEVTIGRVQAAALAILTNVALYATAGALAAKAAPARAHTPWAAALLVLVMVGVVRGVLGVGPIEIGVVPMAIAWTIFSGVLWCERSRSLRAASAAGALRRGEKET